MDENTIWGIQLNDKSVWFSDLAYTKLRNAVVFKLHSTYSWFHAKY